MNYLAFAWMQYPLIAILCVSVLMVVWWLGRALAWVLLTPHRRVLRDAAKRDAVREYNNWRKSNVLRDVLRQIGLSG